MKTITLEAEVSENGYVHLDIPVDLPAGKIELVLVIQPAANGTKQNGDYVPAAKSRQELFDEMEQLLRLGLAGVTWEEIKEGRRDDENRY